MKQTIAKFLLFLHTEHVQEDWHGVKESSKAFLYPGWVIRGFFIYLFFFLYIPGYLIRQTSIVKHYNTEYNAMLFNQNKEENKVKTRNFLNSLQMGKKFATGANKRRK